MSFSRISTRNWQSFFYLACCFALALLAHPCEKAFADEVTGQSILAAALAAANRIGDVGQRAQALDLIVETQAQSGDIPGAKQTADAIPLSSPDDSTVADTAAGWKKDAYANIAGGQAGAGDIAGARATVASLDDPETINVADQYIAQALARKGDITNAKSCAARTSGICRARADAAIARAQAASGDITAAKETIKGLADTNEQALAYAFVAEIQAKNGDQPGARDTVGLAKAAALQVPDYLSQTAFGAVAKAAVKAGDMDGASELRKTGESYISSQIAIAQAEMGDIAAAKETDAQISDPFDHAFAQVSIAEAESRAGDAAGAIQALDSARTAASSISDSSKAAEACGRIVEAWARSGNPTAAADWARSQQDPTVEVAGLIHIARALCPPEFTDDR
jgi:hypothetical protein